MGINEERSIYRCYCEIPLNRYDVYREKKYFYRSKEKKKNRENKNNRNNVGIPGAKTESFRLNKKKRFIYPLRVSGNELPLSRSIEYDFSFRSYIKLQTGTVSREASANKGRLEKEKEERQEEEEEEEDVAVESREFE